MSGAEHILLCPIVPVDRIEEWEEYTEHHHEWIRDVLDVPEELILEHVSADVRSDRSLNDTLAMNKSFLKATTTSFDEVEDIHVVAWQMFPMVSCVGLVFPFCSETIDRKF